MTARPCGSSSTAPRSPPGRRRGTIQATDNPLWIGGNNPYGEYFTGLIDEVRIYNRALTADRHPDRHEHRRRARRRRHDAAVGADGADRDRESPVR